MKNDCKTCLSFQVCISTQIQSNQLSPTDNLDAVSNRYLSILDLQSLSIVIARWIVRARPQGRQRNHGPEDFAVSPDRQGA